MLTAGAVSGGTSAYAYAWSSTPAGTSASSAAVTVSPTTSTSYQLTVTDAQGCTATKSVLIKVKDVRCGNNNDKVWVCHANGGTYGYTANCISPSAVPAHITHGDCLGDCTNSWAKTVGGAATHLGGEGADILVFPNPASTWINISLPERGAAYHSIQVTDINGRIVTTRPLSGDIHAELLTLDVSTYVPGIYTIRAIADNGTGVARFIVK
jgi:hypothetical protein